VESLLYRQHNNAVMPSAGIGVQHKTQLAGRTNTLEHKLKGNVTAVHGRVIGRLSAGCGIGRLRQASEAVMAAPPGALRRSAVRLRLGWGGRCSWAKAPQLRWTGSACSRNARSRRAMHSSSPVLIAL